MLLLHASARTCDANARVYGVVRTGEKHETFGGALSFVLCPLELRLLPSDKSGHQDSTKKTPLRRGSQGSAFLETHPPKHRINRFFLSTFILTHSIPIRNGDLSACA